MYDAMESEGLRFDSSWELRIFSLFVCLFLFFFPNAINSCISRAKDFLLVMREAELALEQELQVKSPTELDIESVDDGAPFIEMVSITLYTLTSESIFFILFSITFLRC